MQLTQRQKRLLRWVGYPLLGIVTFLYALHLTFPYERVKDKLVETLSERYEVEIMSVERTLLPGGMIMNGVMLRSRPTEPDAKPAAVFINKLRVDLSLFALLRRRADVDLVAELGGGTIEGNLQATAAEIKVDVFTESLPLANIPGLKEAVGLPMEGGLNARFSITLPEGRWEQADGTITLSCPGCTIGDGETKIKPPAPGAGRRGSALFAGEGITVPRLNLGNIAGEVTIESGRAKIDKFLAQSVDGELQIAAAIRFKERFKDSLFESGCMRFKLSPELKKRDPNFGSLPDFMRLAPDPEDYAYVKIRGSLTGMRWLATAKCGFGPGEEEGGDMEDQPRARRTRPSLSPGSDVSAGVPPATTPPPTATTTPTPTTPPTEPFPINESDPALLGVPPPPPVPVPETPGVGTDNMPNGEAIKLDPVKGETRVDDVKEEEVRRDDRQEEVRDMDQDDMKDNKPDVDPQDDTDETERPAE